MKAYSELYLIDAKKNLAACFDYAINDCKLNADTFMFMFVNSKYAKLFSQGNPSIVSGISGIELAIKIIEETDKEFAFVEKEYTFGKSAEYWAGYYLAEYQWYTCRSFRNIFERISLSEIISMYYPYHEMDVSKFVEDLEIRICSNSYESKLQKIRKANGLSQSKLAKLANVNLRSIQMYEQRQNDIDKAQVNVLYRLINVLHCDIEDILEDVYVK